MTCIWIRTKFYFGDEVPISLTNNAQMERDFSGKVYTVSGLAPPLWPDDQAVQQLHTIVVDLLIQSLEFEKEDVQ